ncbi:MAG: hypothetical protein DRO11_04430 [Methanobacteriota archaeon]|nr:MAG: hypothetical protein DRO11_04430 [Euryarchaeota archaeon]
MAEEWSIMQFQGIFGRIHPYDYMLADSSSQALEHYRQVGVDAYRCLEHALSLVNRTIADVKLILDFGCGYGRVTRVLVQKVRAEKIHVFDVDPQGPAFCATEFGVTPLIQTKDWASIPFSRYDLIWVGSVFTHLSERYISKMLRLFKRILTSDGLLVFTTHGENALQRLHSGDYGERFRLLGSRIKQEFETRGFCFVPYEDQELSLRLKSRQESEVSRLVSLYSEEIRNYGKTWMSKSFTVSLVQKVFGNELKLLEYRPSAWDNHQDVFVYYRVSSI